MATKKKIVGNNIITTVSISLRQGIKYPPKFEQIFPVSKCTIRFIHNFETYANQTNYL